MKKNLLTPITFAVAILISACSTTPTTTSMLDQAHSDFISAQSNPRVASYAPLELKQSGDALALADAAAKNHESLSEIDKLAYIAKQKIALAQEVAAAKASEASVAAAAKERDQLRLDARTAEADKAKAVAERAKANAAMSEADAERARLAALAAQSQTADALRQTQEAQARAAQLESQLAELSAKKTERGIVITLGDVLFDTNMAVLSANGMSTVQKLANVLNQNPGRSVQIEGHTDSTGSLTHNQELSIRRATAVRDALLSMGVGNDRIVARGYGPSMPVASNGDATGRQLNRRVEIVLSDETGTVARR
jgi:outer membrane protein OmpA-like peptidoglycan-associated protein